MGYLCACFELSNTARRLFFTLRGKYAQFGGPASRGKRSFGRRELGPRAGCELGIRSGGGFLSPRS
jgi:hypothetical protein